MCVLYNQWIKGILTKMNKNNSSYISEIDKKLAKFNRENELTASQKFEQDKYKKIYQLRDHENSENTKEKPINWD